MHQNEDRRAAVARGNLKKVSTTHEELSGPLSRFCVAIGNVLVLLSAILVIVTPLTDYYWHFDRFLSGGQDCEFSLLCVLSICCLVIVLLQHSKSIVAAILCLRQRLKSVPRGGAIASQNSGISAETRSQLLPDPVLTLYNLPLQV